MSGVIDDGGPAFPTENEQQSGPNSYHYQGMSLRDYFAAKALSNTEGPPFRQAEQAYEIADAMLKARTS